MNLIQYFLNVVAEEAGEVSQAALKANRFGLRDVYPKKFRGTAQDRLVHELNDLMEAIHIAQEVGALPKTLWDGGKMAEKRAKLIKYAFYSYRKRILKQSPARLRQPTDQSPTRRRRRCAHRS